MSVRQGLLTLFVLVALVPVRWAAAAEKSSILEDEPALAKPVTVSAYRIYLGELLERISRETGVRLETDDRQAPVSGYQLALVMREKPAWQVLEAVRRLYHFPPDRWYWSREREGRYVLHNTLSLSQARALREQHAAELLLAERRRLLNSGAPAGPRTGAAFIGALSDAEFRSIVAGNPLTVPADRLSAPQRAFLMRIFEDLNLVNRQAPDVLEGKRQPTELRLDEVREVTIRRDDRMFSGLPGIVVQAGTVRSSLLTGLGSPRSPSGNSGSPWVQADESVTAPDVPAPTPAPERPATGGGPEDTLDRMLERIGHTRGVDLIYDRPAGKLALFYRSPGNPPTDTLPELLTRLSRQYLTWKQWSRTVLFRLADWESNPREVLVPWNTIRQLRSQIDADGNPTLERFFLLAFLSPEQREELRDEFPFPWAGQRDEEVASVLQFAAGTTREEREAMSGRTGAGWADWSPNTRQRAANFLGDPHIRVHLKLTTQNRRSTLEYGIAPEVQPLETRYAPIFPPRPNPGTLYPPAAAR